MASPAVAVVVPVYGKLPLTLRFLESFAAVTYNSYKIVIVDDASPDGTGAHVARHFPEVTVLSGDGDLWWSGGTNKGVRYALRHGFRYVLTINNDAQVRPDFLDHLVETAEANPHSLVGSRIQFLDPPERVWSVGGYTNWGPGFFLNLCEHSATEADLLARRSGPVPVQVLTGCGALIPTGCYRDIGFYDERMCPQYHADSELTLRAARAGWRVLVDLRAVVYNDVPNTCTVKNIFAKRSPWYWRPLLAIHWRYCPRGRFLKALLRQYRDVLVDQFYPALDRFRKRAGGLFRRAG